MKCERVRRTRGERGSALLIVFVFAAMVAILLYSEMPVAVFEAKRQKEQLLIDRGNEYAHAVKLYVRKFGMYPSSVEQLEDTNRMRFLRHRYKDPFTGKENWRMLHAGPGGQLVDSHVKPTGLGVPGANGAEANAGSGFGSSSTGSSFGSSNTGSGLGATNSGSSFGSNTGSGSIFGESSFGSSGNSQETVVVPDLPQRPPAISASGTPSTASSSENASTAAESEQSPTTSLVPDNLREQMAAVEQGQISTGTENAGQANGEPAAGAGQPVQGGAGQAAQNGGAGQAGVAGSSAGSGARQNAMGNPAIGAPLQGSGTGNSSGMGQIAGGGIAGVASIAKGHSIKVVNDQTDYSLWEFYYDPTKDATRNMPGLGTGTQGTGQTGAGANGTNTGSSGQGIFQQNSTSGFGQSSGASGFGQSSGGTSSAGTATQPSNPPQ